MTTMSAVARAAGVSTTTVSHVINGSRPVSPAARKSVEEAISSLGYRHNTLARSLAVKQTNSLGIAISLQSNPYFNELISSIEKSAFELGYSIFISDTHEQGDVEAAVIERFLSQRVDGIILAPSSSATDTLSAGIRAAAPIVLVDRRLELELDSVAPENVQSVAHAVSHLVNQGHKRIAFMAGLDGVSTSIERRAGYVNGLRESGLEVDPALIMKGDSDADQAARAFEHAVVEQGTQFTAVVAGNNNMAKGVVRAIRRLDLPKNSISLIAYDDLDWWDLLDPGVSAIAQDISYLGRRAVELMHRRILNPTAPYLTDIAPARLIHRESCCPSVSLNRAVYYH